MVSEKHQTSIGEPKAKTILFNIKVQITASSIFLRVYEIHTSLSLQRSHEHLTIGRWEESSAIFMNRYGYNGSVIG